MAIIKAKEDGSKYLYTIAEVLRVKDSHRRNVKVTTDHVFMFLKKYVTELYDPLILFL